jgi:hypothetical protein
VGYKARHSVVVNFATMPATSFIEFLNRIRMKWVALFLLTVLLFAQGCRDQEREKELKNWQTALTQKEQELNEKQNMLQLKEQELLHRQRKADSARMADTALHQDTARLHQPAITGLWSVKMTCTETTCAGSAIGDTKNEQWNIASDGNQVLAKAMAGDKLVRDYSGVINERAIELKANSDSTSAQLPTRMHVTLRVVDSTSMQGEREIVRNDCRVIYSLQLAKLK